jgi:Family of unknown function (DUF6516)
MKAELLFSERLILAENRFVEMVVWQVPNPVAGSVHHYKYRLAWVIDGVCVLRYDNEAGKGDHKHQGDVECAILFNSVDQLINDFLFEVEHWEQP